jgi:hypothetical protein
MSTAMTISSKVSSLASPVRVLSLRCGAAEDARVELVYMNGPDRAGARDLGEAAATAGVEWDDERRLVPLCTLRDEAELRPVLL